MRKIIMLVLLLLALVGAGVYFFVINKPHKNVANEKAIDITASQLFVEYTANEKVANDKYLNKAIEVSGTIATIDKNQDGQQFIVLKTDDDFNGIMCTMKTPDLNHKVDDRLQIIGYCSGFVGDVKLTDCIIATP